MVSWSEREKGSTVATFVSLSLSSLTWMQDVVVELCVRHGWNEERLLLSTASFIVINNFAHTNLLFQERE